MFTSQDQISLTSLDNREHEVFESIVNFDDWQRCQHGKQLVTVMAHWSDDAPFTVTTGCVNHTQRFTRTVHADGSPIPIRNAGYLATDCYGQHHKCPKCGTIDSCETKQLAYGDQTDCTVEGCDYSSYYSIGD